jgi:hypothetical protein
MKKSALLTLCALSLLLLGSCKGSCPKFSINLGTAIGVASR